MPLAYSKSWCNTVTGRNIQRKHVTTVITLRIIHYWTSLELNWQFRCRCVTLESVFSAPAGSTRSLKSPLLQDGKTHTDIILCWKLNLYVVLYIIISFQHGFSCFWWESAWFTAQTLFQKCINNFYIRMLWTCIPWLHSCRRWGSTPRGHKFKRWR